MTNHELARRAGFISLEGTFYRESAIQALEQDPHNKERTFALVGKAQMIVDEPIDTILSRIDEVVNGKSFTFGEETL